MIQERLVAGRVDGWMEKEDDEVDEGTGAEEIDV